MQTRTTGPALADPVAREFLRAADPVLARIIAARPDFRPRAWTNDLPARDAFSTLIFQVIGQQLSVRATRTILGRLEQMFGGRLPTPAEMLKGSPRNSNAATPPVIANGTSRKMSKAGDSSWNANQSRKRISARARGTTRKSLSRASM